MCVITGERNATSLNPIAEPYVNNSGSKDCKIKDEIEAEKGCSRDDANYNKNKEEDWENVLKKEFKVQRKECKVIETKNQHEALKDDNDCDDDEEEEVKDAKVNFDMIVIPSIAYFYTTKEFVESTCDNKKIKLKKKCKKVKMKERKAIEIVKEIMKKTKRQAMRLKEIM